MKEALRVFSGQFLSRADEEANSKLNECVNWDGLGLSSHPCLGVSVRTALSPCTSPDGIWVQAITSKMTEMLNLATLQQLSPFPGPAPSALIWKGEC